MFNRWTHSKDSLVGPYLREADMRSAEGKETELKWQINAPAMSRSVKANVDSAFFRKVAEPLSPLLESLVPVLAAMISTSRNEGNRSVRKLHLSFEACDESLTTR